MQKNYTFEVNPGKEKQKQGLYYYLVTCAKAIEALGIKKFDDGKPVLEDLKKAVMKLQNEDGSWVNLEDRWWEDNPVLITGYMLAAIGYIRKLDKK